jgi:hypothetical protein
MLLSYVIAFDQLIRTSRKRHRDAFADPLDAPEWRGVAPIFQWVAALRTRRRLRRRRDATTESDDCARAKSLPARLSSNTPMPTYSGLTRPAYRSITKDAQRP